MLYITSIYLIANMYLLITYYVPSMVLGPRDIIVNERVKKKNISALSGLLGRRDL